MYNLYNRKNPKVNKLIKKLQ